MSVGVHCSACGADLGAQHRPGDGMALFVAHVPVCPYGGENPRAGSLRSRDDH